MLFGSRAKSDTKTAAKPAFTPAPTGPKTWHLTKEEEEAYLEELSQGGPTIGRMKLMAAFECHINYANRYTSAKLDDPNPEVQKKVRTDLGRLAFLRTLIRGNLPQYGCNKHPSLFD